MEVLYARVCGLDVHKKTVVACVRRMGEGDRVWKEVRTFATLTHHLRALVAWLQEHGVTPVAMESTGTLWKPVYMQLEVARARQDPLRASPLLPAVELRVRAERAVGDHREQRPLEGLPGSLLAYAATELFPDADFPPERLQHGQPSVRPGGPDRELLRRTGVSRAGAVREDPQDARRQPPQNLEDYGVEFQLSSDFGLPEGFADVLAPWRETHPTVAR